MPLQMMNKAEVTNQLSPVLMGTEPVHNIRTLRRTVGTVYHFLHATILASVFHIGAVVSHLSLRNTPATPSPKGTTAVLKMLMDEGMAQRTIKG
jgi:hypothetical protein